MNDSNVIEFGEVTLAPGDELSPALPAMSYLVIKYDDDPIAPYIAICIELELDASGSSIEEAYTELSKSINLYINSHARNCHTVKELAENIIDIMYDSSEQKSELTKLYHKIEYQCLGNDSRKIDIAKDKSFQESIFYSLHKETFQTVAVNVT
jgi:hypothetical protein